MGLMLLMSSGVFAQHIIGYMPSYRDANSPQYAKYTDVVYAFVNPDGADGGLHLTTGGGALYTFNINHFLAVKAKCVAANVKFHISLGGADPAESRSANLSNVCGNNTKRATLVNELVDFAVLHNLAGIDIDWEFPKNATAKANHKKLLQDLRAEITARSLSITIGVAVGGEYAGGVNHLNYFDPTAFQYVDEFRLMTYDYPNSALYGVHHSTVADAQGAITGWANAGVPKSKMAIGVPYYSKPASRCNGCEQNYKDFATSTYYNDADGAIGDIYYNSCPVIEQKVDLILGEGGQGILIWDMGQDATDASGLSLTSCLKTKMDAACLVPDVSLGQDKGICLPGSVTLDGGVTTGGGRTFKWYKDNVLDGSQTGPTMTNVSSSGTYKLEVSDASCTKTDEVKVVAASQITTVDGSACVGNPIPMSVSTAGGPYDWYDAQTAGTVVTTGSSYSPSLVATDTFWVQDGSTSQTYDVGQALMNKPAAWVTGDSPAETFGHDLTVHQDITISSLMVWTNGPMVIDFVLVDKFDGTTVVKSSGNISVNGDAVVVPLDMTVPAGTYILGAKKISGSGVLLYEPSVSYPTSVPGIIDIAGTSWVDFNGGTDFVIGSPIGTHYGVMYGWKVSTGVVPPCGRERVIGVVEPNSAQPAAIVGTATPTQGTTESYSVTNVANTTFTWAFSGTGGTINNQGSNAITIDYSASATAGDLTVTATTVGMCGASTAQTKGITLGAGNQAPTGVAITAPTTGVVLELPVTVNFTGTATDSDGNIATFVYVITGPSPATTETSVTGTGMNFAASWTPTVAGTYTVIATATDDGGASTPSTSISITVNAANLSPVVSITAPTTGSNVPVSQAVSLTASATDTDGNIQTLFYAITGPDPTTALGGAGPTFTGTWTPTVAGTYTIVAKATDDDGAQTTSASITVTVDPPLNVAPTGVAITAPTTGTTINLTETVNFTGTATDADGNIASFVYNMTGAATDQVTGTGPSFAVNWTPTVAGTYTVIATATDDDGASTPSTSITITVNEAPTVTITAPTNGSSFVLGAANITATAADNDGSIASVTYAITGGTNLTGSGGTYLASWTPTGAGLYTIIATATDNDGGTSTHSISVTVTDPLNNAPTGVTITTPANGASVMLPSGSFNFTGTATDADGSIASFVYDITGAATDQVTGSGATFAASWTPTVAGTYTVVATATDDDGANTPSTSITITVDPAANVAPTGVAITSPTTGANVTLPSGSFSFTGTATDADGSIASFVYDITGPATDQVTGSGGTFAASWTPTVAGTYTVIATATDDDGAPTSSSSISITVDPVVIGNNAPTGVAITAPTTGASVNLPSGSFNFTGTATDADGSIASFVYDITGPATDQVTGSGGTFAASWTPTVAGTYTVIATATDDDGAPTSSSSISITVIGTPDNEATITIVSPTDGETMGDDPYLIQVTATDPDGLSTVQVKIINPNLAFPFNEEVLTLTDDGSGNYSTTWGASIVGDFTMTVITTDVNGGTTESNSIAVTVDSDFGVGIDDDLDLSKLSMVVYPNPTIGDANVDFNIRNAGSGTLTILDMSGNIVDIVSEGGFGVGVQTTYLRTSDLAVGIYILRLNVDGEIIISKFVKE